MRKGRIIILILLPVLFMAGVVIGYHYLMSRDEPQPDGQSLVAMSQEENKIVEDTIALKVYYPENKEIKLVNVEVKKSFNTIRLLTEALNEFFSGHQTTSLIPRQTRVLGVYYGYDKILYVDLSPEFRKNFSGDAIDEFLLLKSLYKTIEANVEVDDVMVLINGAEADSLGGHFFLKYPLKRLIVQELRTSK